MLPAQRQMRSPRNGVQNKKPLMRKTRKGVTFKPQKRIAHCERIPTPSGLKKMLKTRTTRQKDKSRMRSTLQRVKMTTQERAQAVSRIPPGFQFDQNEFQVVVSLRGSETRVPSYLAEYTHMTGDWQPPEVCTTGTPGRPAIASSKPMASVARATTSACKLPDGFTPGRPAIATSKPTALDASAMTRASKPSDGIKPRGAAIATSKPTASVARAKTSASNAADGMKPGSPAVAAAGAAASVARAKTGTSKPAAAKTSASKPVSPALQQQLQASAAATGCDSKRKRPQFKPFGWYR